jgi:hypothetical protein
MRTFTDASGLEWQVWEVHPGAFVPDAAPDRREAPAPEPVIERRSGTEQRRQPRHPALVRPGFEAGWLCFQAGPAVRRLAPVPPDWELASDAELEAYCRRAVK